MTLVIPMVMNPSSTERFGGGGGIRTHETLSGLTVFNPVAGKMPALPKAKAKSCRKPHTAGKIHDESKRLPV